MKFRIDGIKFVLLFFVFSPFLSAEAGFDRNLSVGAAGDDVKALQEFLIQENVYPEKLITGYFGELTKKAVTNFQEKYASEILAPLGLTYGTGFFGPMSRKKADLNYGGRTSVVSVVTTFSPAPANFDTYDGIDDYKIFDEGENLMLGENFEISFKLRFSAGKLATIIQRGSDSVDDKYWYVQTMGDASGRLEFQISDGIGFALIQTSVAMNDGKWHEVVWTRSGDTHAIKVDGIDRTVAGNIDPGIGDINAPKPIYIGGDPQTNENFFKGDIGEIKIILK